MKNELWEWKTLIGIAQRNKKKNFFLELFLAKLKYLEL